MPFVPAQYSVILKVLMSPDNCTKSTHINEIENDCDSYDTPKIDNCCQQIIDSVYGQHKLNTCYPYQLVNRNETFIKFVCDYPINADKDFNSIMGMLLIILALCILIGCSLKWNIKSRGNPDKEKQKKITDEKQLLLNTQYQTFK